MQCSKISQESTRGNTELEAVLLRASDLPDIFTLALFVLEVIDFRTIIERAARFIESKRS